jgi:hypothetical protein
MLSDPNRFLFATLKVCFFLLLFVAIFDPGDKLTHLKIPLFVSVWLVFLAWLWITNPTMQKRSWISLPLLLYVLLFSFCIPLYGVLISFLRGSDVSNSDGFMYVKSYLFVTIAIPLSASKIDVSKQLRGILSLLSIMVLATSALVYLYPSLRIPVSLFGDESK